MSTAVGVPEIIQAGELIGQGSYEALASHINIDTGLDAYFKGSVVEI